MQAIRTVTTPFSLTLTLNTPLDPTGFTSPELTYWSQHRLYYNTEYGRVQISLDEGAAWTTVQPLTDIRVGEAQLTFPDQDTNPALYPDREDLSPDWSSDGTRIVFVRASSDGTMPPISIQPQPMER